MADGGGRKTQKTMNICDKVRKSCLDYITNNTNHVQINKDQISKLATQILDDDHQQQQQNNKNNEEKVGVGVVWDEEGWHYRPPIAHIFDASQQQQQHQTRQERIALYILALDAINFCFWPSSSSSSSCDYQYEYEDLATTLTSIASSDHPTPTRSDGGDGGDGVNDDDENTTTKTATSLSTFKLSPHNLSKLTPTDMEVLFQNHHTKGWTPPNIEQRCRLLNEVGTVLLEKFDGMAMNLIDQANGSAVNLVQLLFDNFTGFQDTAIAVQTRGISSGSDPDSDAEIIYFLKRGQICVGDWNAALQLNLHDISQLTTFADYRVPQLLRHCGVLQYATQLATKIDTYVELELNSCEELSIRAATVTAVEYLVDEIRNQQQQQQQLNNKNNGHDDNECWTAVQVDWYLWQVGEKTKDSIKPHHRVRTIYY